MYVTSCSEGCYDEEKWPKLCVSIRSICYAPDRNLVLPVAVLPAISTSSPPYATSPWSEPLKKSKLA